MIRRNLGRPRSILSTVGSLVALALCMVAGFSVALTASDARAHRDGAGPVRILHVMSYHTPWRWTEDQLNGFKDGLGLPDAVIRVYEMDTKRRSSLEWKREAAAEARRLIDEWKPDLLYVNDDNAQEFVARHYLDTEMPIVFSGVNADPADYGLEGQRNVTGVLETEHFVQTVKLLRKIVPEARRLAVIYDDGPTWPSVIQRMRERLQRLDEVMVVDWLKINTFADYKRTMLDLHGKVDAIGLLGIFTFVDDTGNNVPIETVLRWTAENSKLPDFAFWRDRVDHGTLVAVAVSGYQQGLAAGLKARKILVEQVPPSSLPIEATVKGQPFVSLARAKALDIPVKSSVLLSSQVVTDYIWQRGL